MSHDGDGENVFARAWAEAVVGTNFVPGTRANLLAVLRQLTHRLGLAVVTPAYADAIGRAIGADLWAADVISPDALGRTISLILGRLLTDLGITDPRAPAVLVAAVGDLAAGFGTELERKALRAAEGVNRAQRDAWRVKQRELQARINHQRFHDPVTGLPNRSALMGHLREAITTARPGDRLGVCALHVNRVAAVRHNLGPVAGDQMLRDLAQRLPTPASWHYLAQLDPDTFMLVVDATTGTVDVEKALHEAVRALPNPWTFGDNEIPVAVTASIVERAAEGADPATLIRDAEMALAWANDDPALSPASYDPQRAARDHLRYRLTNELPRAMTTQALTLAYQPIVSLADQSVIMHEALLRWHHPQLGPVNPATVVAIATDVGLADTLGEYVLDHACRHAAQERHQVARISVNVVAAQLRNPDFPAIVRQTLQRHHLAPYRLIIEITEQDQVGSDPHSVAALPALRALGVDIAIDDFGTGYSNLANLSTMPVTMVKLAADLCRDITADTSVAARNAEMITHVVQLTHSLGLTVVAEGIEHHAQADKLRDLGCDLGQGFHFGRPGHP